MLEAFKGSFAVVAGCFQDAKCFARCFFALGWPVAGEGFRTYFPVEVCEFVSL